MQSEFEFIDRLKLTHRLHFAGDDCAVLPYTDLRDLLITSDMLVEDVDFRLGWGEAESLGHKTLAVSLSDVAAMGGTPEFGLLSIAVVENLWKTDFLERFYAGWFELAKEWGVELVGGDVSRSPDKLVIDSTVLGSVPKRKAIRRSGATPGNGIFVSGTLGGAAAGLKVLEENGCQCPELVKIQLRPSPQVELGKCLQELELATAMIDVSDGLGSDLAHICRSSGVGAIVHADKVPIHPSVRLLVPDDEALQLALSGGEDFQLLFTADPARLAATGIENVTQIGEITDHEGRLDLEVGGELQPLDAIGFRHF